MAAASLARLGPDAAVLLLTLGLLLVWLELNRPGWILPGALGLLFVLLATAAALLLLDLLRPTPSAVALAAILALVLGLLRLVVAPAPPRVHLATAIACGLLLGGSTSVLTRIARRARANKALD